MAYNPAIPTATDPTPQSAQQIRSNFNAISAIFSTNHQGINDDLEGKHRGMLLTAVSDPTTTADQIAIYNKIVSSVPQLFFRPNSNQTPIQLTYDSIDTDGAAKYTFLAGPFVVYAGLLTAVTNGQLVTLLPSTTLVYVGLTTANNKNTTTSNATTAATNISGNSFNIEFQAGLSAFDVFYIAIGIP